jgi:hypothetical protein
MSANLDKTTTPISAQINSSKFNDNGLPQVVVEIFQHNNDTVKLEYFKSTQDAAQRILCIKEQNTDSWDDIVDYDLGAMKFFALLENGRMLILGNHGDSTAANLTTEDMKKSFSLEDQKHIIYNEPEAQKLMVDFYGLLDGGSVDKIGIDSSGDWYSFEATQQISSDSVFTEIDIDQINGIYQKFDLHLPLPQSIAPLASAPKRKI